jgi:hypothetical protein
LLEIEYAIKAESHVQLVELYNQVNIICLEIFKRTNISIFSNPLLLSSETYFSRDRGKIRFSRIHIFESLILAPDAFPFSVTELRLLTILQQIPFVIPFDTRVQVIIF